MLQNARCISHTETEDEPLRPSGLLGPISPHGTLKRFCDSPLQRSNGWRLRKGHVAQASRREECRRPRVLGVHMTSEDNDSDSARAGQLESRCRRLGAAARDPRVVYNEDVAAGNRIADANPAWVNVPGVDLCWDYGQSHQGEGDARQDQADKRMSTRAALPARHHRDGCRPGVHVGPPPQRIALVPQEGGQRFSQPRRGLRRVRGAIRFIPAQVLSQWPAAHCVPDRRHSICENPASLAHG
jgi:hypothetical protein